MKRKLISSLLCLCMLFSLLPVAAFAADPDPTETTVPPEVEAYGFVWEAEKYKKDTTNGTTLTGGYHAGSDWMNETMYVVLKENTSANQNLWFEVTIGEGEDAPVWGCAAETDGTHNMFAFSFLNRTTQWEQVPTGITVGEGNQHATKYMADTKATSATLKVYVTEELFTTQNHKLPQNATPVFNQKVAITANKDTMEVVKDTPVDPTPVPAPELTITAAPLHDQSGRVPDNGLCTGYSVTQPDKDNKIVVSASNVRLHKNADDPAAYGYWTGVQFKAPDGYTVKYKMGNMENWTLDADDGSYVSLYSDFEKKSTSTISIALFRDDALVTGTDKTYTIDFSGVKKMEATATLGYTALADKTIVSDCINETMYVKFDDALRPGWLWFTITDPEGVVYEIAASANESEETGKLPTIQAWSFQNKGQFEVWPGKGTENEAALGVKDGTYKVVGYIADVAEAPTVRPEDEKLTKIFEQTVAVTAPAKDVTVVEPAKADVDTAGLVGADGKPVTEETAEAISNALENVKPTETSAGILQNAADTSAKDTSTKYSDKEDAASKLNTATGTTDATKDNVSIVYQPYLKVEAKTYDETSKSLTVNITPMCNVLATTKGNENNLTFGQTTGNTAVKLGEEELTVSKPIEMTIGLPVGFVTNSAGVYPSVYVQHKGYEYTAAVTEVKSGDSVTGLLAAFINPHGFSDFTVTATTQTVATIDDVSYTSLQAAVEAAKDGDTIVLQKQLTGDAAKADVSLSAAKTLSFKNASGTAVSELTINGKTVTVNSTTAVTETFPKTTGGSNGGGGGGGVSSNVTIDRPTNGKVSVSPTAPSKGATVTITLTPDTGYVVGSVTVTDKDGKAVELTKVSDTKYTFTMPDGKVKVAATFTKAGTPTEGFTDVAADAYYADAVKWAVDKGITNGLTATTFGPNNSCTRGQMVTFLWRAAGSPAATGTNSFSDVASGEYYYNAVLWAVEKGITNGTSATTFSPNATVNRGQTVTFLYRYAGTPAATGTSSFTDVAADAFYADAVKWAVAEEITNGTSSTTFSPASNCTRGQIVTFMYRQMAE